jgi:hypothetical protein
VAEGSGAKANSETSSRSLHEAVGGKLANRSSRNDLRRVRGSMCRMGLIGQDALLIDDDERRLALRCDEIRQG